MSSRNETAIELKGLREDNPRDFLAALGLFESLNAQYSGGNMTMKWNELCPVISIEGRLEENWEVSHCQWIRDLFLNSDLPQNLADELEVWKADEYHKEGKERQAKAHILSGTSVNSTVTGATARLPPSLVHKLLLWHQSNFMDDEHTSRPTVNLTLSLTSQVHSSYDKKIKRDVAEISYFSMANKQGEKHLLYGAQRIASNFYSPQHFSAVLGRNVEMCDDAPTLRWSPSEYRSAAYFGEIPQFRDHPPKNLLALLGLAFYPLVDRKTKVLTAGFTNRAFCWPIWTPSLTRAEVYTILHTRALHGTASSRLDELAAMGILRAWRSSRISDPNKNVFFQNAEPIF